MADGASFIVVVIWPKVVIIELPYILNKRDISVRMVV